MNVKSILVDLFKTEAIEEMAIAELNPHKVIQSSKSRPQKSHCLSDCPNGVDGKGVDFSFRNLITPDNFEWVRIYLVPNIFFRKRAVKSRLAKPTS